MSPNKYLFMMIVLSAYKVYKYDLFHLKIKRYIFLWNNAPLSFSFLLFFSMIWETTEWTWKNVVAKKREEVDSSSKTVAILWLRTCEKLIQALLWCLYLYKTEWFILNITKILNVYLYLSNNGEIIHVNFYFFSVAFKVSR